MEPDPQTPPKPKFGIRIAIQIPPHLLEKTFERSRIFHGENVSKYVCTLMRKKNYNPNLIPQEDEKKQTILISISAPILIDTLTNVLPHFNGDDISGYVNNLIITDLEVSQ